jgi:hypothetical protein
MAKSNSNSKIDQIDAFHKTLKGRILFGLAELMAAYLFVSLAIDSGSLWHYGLAILFAIGGLNNLVRVFTTGGIRSDGKKPAKKR